jgi:hypothetical protein
MKTNSTSAAVDELLANELTSKEWYAISQKYKLMEKAIEEAHSHLAAEAGRFEWCSIQAAKLKHAFDYDPLSP